MKSFFLDGSALAKRYVPEPETPLVDHLVDRVAADRLIVLNVGVAEVVSVLVRRKNAGALSHATFGQALLHLGREIIHVTSLRKVDPTNSLVIAALGHIQIHSLNATDAIVLHAALGIAHLLRNRGDDLALVASDQRLLRAAQTEGLATFNPESQDLAVLAAFVGP